MLFRHYTQSYLNDNLKSKLPYIIDFAFKGGDKTFIRLSNNGAAYWEKKPEEGLGFSKTLIKKTINYLIENCYFNLGSVTMKQAIGIPMEIDPVPENLFLYSYEEEGICHY